MRLLSIDASTTSTGWCIYDKKPIKFGCICPNKKLEYLDRVIYILKELNALKLKYKPEIIVIEQLAITRNAKVARMLAGLQTSIEVLFKVDDYLIIEVRPTEARKGKIKSKKREEIKKEVVEYVFNNYKIKVNDDIADSILLAEYINKLDIESEEINK